MVGNPSPNDRLRFVIDPYGFSELSNLRIRFLDEHGHDVMPERNALVVETEGVLGNVRSFRVVVEGTDSISKYCSLEGKFRHLYAYVSEKFHKHFWLQNDDQQRYDPAISCAGC